MVRNLSLVALFLATTTHGYAEAPVAAVSRSPHAVIRPIGIDEVRWTNGFWANRERINRERSIPAMWELMRDSRYKPFYEHFLIAAGLAEGEYHGAAWNDGDFYKWIEAACSVLASRDDPVLFGAVNQAIDAIVAAQRDDGYLHTPVLIARRNGNADARPFADRHDFEVYNLGHLMTAACLHHRVTDDDRLLSVAERAARFLEGAFAEATPQMARQAVCPSHYMGLVELYRTTRDERYLRLAQRVLRLRKLASGVEGGGGDDNQDRIPFVDQREAVGHAVRANYLYAGATDVFLETGDQSLRPALEAIWRNVREKKLYITGGCGALYDGASPDGSPEQQQITRIHQAYGRNYQLPNTTAHNETCAAIGSLLWNWREFLATGDARCVDWIELSLYNAVLSGVSLSGTEYFYTNPLRLTDPLPNKLRWSRERQEFIVSYCCPPNLARTIAQVGGYAYSKDDEGVLVNLYGANEFSTQWKDSPLRLEQKTNYPWDGEITLRVLEVPDEPMAIRLRQPGWATTMAIRVNDRPVHPQQERGFRPLRRRWRPGDVVTIDLSMDTVALESHPLVEETRNEIAIKRGPVVYCLESIDLPPDIDLDRVRLDPATEFSIDRSGELGGVAVLRGTAHAIEARPWQSLYRPVEPSSESCVPVQFVPYFAWGNRGPSEMTVWLPRR